MYCFKHPGRVAATTCRSCGSPVCAECAEKTAPLRENYGVLCLDCARKETEEAIDFYRDKKKKSLKRLIISTILYVFGIATIIAGIAEGVDQAYVMLLVGVIMCGFYTGMTWRKAAQDSHDDYERKHGATYTVTDNGVYKEDGFWMKLIFFLIGVALGVVITPIRFFIDLFSARSTGKTIKELQAYANSLA